MRKLSEGKKREIAELIQVNALDCQEIFEMIPSEIIENERIGQELRKQILHTLFIERLKKILE